MNQALSAQFVPNWSVLTHLVHLIVIWQCPSGTEFGDNIVQFIFFFSSFGFPEDFRTEAKEVYRISVHQCEHFVGTSPQNLLTIFFWFFEKILSPKKSNFFFSILGQKTMQIDVIWSQEYGKIVFLSKKNFKKFRFLDLENFQKIFQKNVKFFQFFFSKILNFFSFFAKF